MAFNPDEERQLKEILYLLMEKIRATKAAFYVVDSSGMFGLACSYGFGRSDRIPDRVARTDQLIVTVNAHRDLYMINDVTKAGPLTDLMAASSSTRMLIAPLYVETRLTGVLDVRDKAAREPFVPEDAGWVREVLGRLETRLRDLGRLTPTAPPEEEMPIERLGQAAGAAPRRPAEPSPEPAPPAGAGGYLPGGTARTMKFVEETLARAAGRGRTTVNDPGGLRAVLDTCAWLPGVEVAALTTVSRTAAASLVASRRPLGPDAGSALLENVEKVVARSAAFGMAEARTLSRTALPPSGAPVTRAEVAAIQSSVVATSRDEIAVLSLAFRQGTSPESREELRAIHALVRGALPELRGATAYRESYKALVNKLLEPGLKKYAALRTHSFNVGRMARRFAGFLGLSPLEIEQMTVAAILHDVGMRDLNYDDLYAKRDLDDEERRLLREHARVGGFLLDDIGWPYPVAPLVRHHHERWDGAGYPDGRKGDEIPFGSRLIHVCEAFDAMTSPASYRAVVSVPQALEIIEGKSGTQFDPELGPEFRRLVESLPGQK